MANTRTKNIFQVRNINNQQTINTNRWTMFFPGLRTKLKAAETSKLPWIKHRYAAVAAALTNTDTELDEALQLSLFSVSFPNVGLEVGELAKFNDQVKTVNKFTAMPDMNVVFYDYVNGSASAIMQLWHVFVGDKKTGAIGFKKDFILPTAYFRVYGPDAPGYDVDSGSALDIPWLQEYEILNLFPKEIQLGEHGDAAEPRKVTCVFCCDNIYPVAIRTYLDKGTEGMDYSARPNVPATI